MKVSDYVIEFIRRIGCKHIFLVTGGGCMHLTDSLNNVDIDYICTHHEQGAAMAAEIYSRLTENIGCVLVTSGPGATNAITGVISAWIDSIPLIVISGQCSSNQLIGNSGERQVGVQEADIVSIVSSMSKYAVQVTNKEGIPSIMNEAYRQAISRRPGPVWIDIPVDIQGQNIDTDVIVNTPIDSSINKVQEGAMVSKAISEAERPIIYLGNGIRLGKAMPEMYELIHRVGTLVQTTWGSIDFLDYNDSLYAGHPGMWGQRWANMITQRSDLILCLGTRLSYPQTGYNIKSWAKNARRIFVDIDQAVLDGINSRIGGKCILSGVKEFIRSLLDSDVEYPNYSKWVKECNILKNKYPMVVPEYNTDTINSYVFIDYLSDYTSKDYVITTDVGNSFTALFPTWKVKMGQRIVNQSGLSSMGHSLPSSIGSWFATGRPQLSLSGDGGFSMNIQELQTIRHHNIPVKIFIFCNDSYTTIKHTQVNHFKRLTATNRESGISMPDFSAISMAYGIPSYDIKCSNDIRGGIERVMSMEGPVLCSVYIDPMQELVPRLSTKFVDGKFTSPEFDDMYPFI